MTILNTNGVQNPQQSDSTSGVYTFQLVRDDVIRDAMQNLALLEESEVPTAKEIADCSRKLNMIVKQLAGTMDKAPGFKMWQRERGDLFLSSTQFSYNLGVTGDHWAGGVTGLADPYTFQTSTLKTPAAINAVLLTLSSLTAVNINDYFGVYLGPDIFWTTITAINTVTNQVTIANPLTAAAAGATYCYNYTKQAQRPVEILTGNLVDPQITNTPLTKMTLEQYEALPTNVQPGYVQDPTAWYYEPRRANLSGRLYIDCAGAQDTTKHLHFVYLRQAQDFANPGDLPDFPQEWYNHLCWSLTLAIHGMFDCDWTQGLQAAYSTATQPAREQSPATSSAFFQPDDDDNY